MKHDIAVLKHDAVKIPDASGKKHAANSIQVDWFHPSNWPNDFKLDKNHESLDYENAILVPEIAQVAAFWKIWANCQSSRLSKMCNSSEAT